MSHVIKKNDTQKIRERSEARFYRALALLSVFIMMTAAYVTYGNQGQEKEFIVVPAPATQNVPSKSQSLSITADLSQIPSEKELKKILNKNLPHTCKDCDDRPLDCLDKYTLDKVLMKNAQRESILSVDVLTDKGSKKYSVVINLSRSNEIVKKGGEIAKKACIDGGENDENEGSGDGFDVIDGNDDPQSKYVNTL